MLWLHLGALGAVLPPGGCGPNPLTDNLAAPDASFLPCSAPAQGSVSWERVSLFSDAVTVMTRVTTQVGTRPRLQPPLTPCLSPQPRALLQPSSHHSSQHFRPPRTCALRSTQARLNARKGGTKAQACVCRTRGLRGKALSWADGTASCHLPPHPPALPGVTAGACRLLSTSSTPGPSQGSLSRERTHPPLPGEHRSQQVGVLSPLLQTPKPSPPPSSPLSPPTREGVPSCQ